MTAVLGRCAGLLCVLGVGVMSSGCVSLRAATHTCATAAFSPAVTVNGARVRLQLKPDGTSGGSYSRPAQGQTAWDGALEVLADLSVVAHGRSERRLVRFRLEPSQKRQDEFIFIPIAIVKSIGKSPTGWEDTGWD